MYANDEIGDCTCAAHGHRIIAQERQTSQREVKVTTQDVIDVYSAVTGFNVVTRQNDNGAYMLDILNYMRHTGMGREKDGTRHTIGAFVQAQPANKYEMKIASYMFGGVYFGAWMPMSVLNQGANWEVAFDATGRPGSWGGHAMYSPGYDSKGIHIISWGQKFHATWEWVHRYVDEAYAMISEDYLYSKKQTTPRGFSPDKLQRALDTLNG
jgi:hypothetical protein